MFIWVGCDINSKFYEFRENVKQFNEELQLDDGSLRLPQHISLKISFELEEGLARHCMKDMVEFLKNVKPFTVRTGDLEIHENILWLRIEECAELKYLHDELDEIGVSYAVKRHEYDKNFIFHTTVIMDGDGEKLKKMYDKVSTLSYPEEIKINTFLVGRSEDNVNFKVERRIKVK